MHNRNIAKEWMKASIIDLTVIEEIINNESLSTMTAFHSQQSIEKSLKAILEYYNQDIPKIHQIKKLFNLTKHYIEFNTDKEIIIKIDTLYIDSRYPGDMGLLPYGKPTIKDAKEFYKFAQSIFDKVCSALEIDKNELR